MRYPSYLNKLIEQFKKLPGVGSKTAERFAFQMLSWSPEHRKEMAELIGGISSRLECCTECGSLCENEKCTICQDVHRDRKIICVVATQKEVFSFEGTGQFKGLYHVLGQIFSPLEGKLMSDDVLLKLKNRIKDLETEEIIIALDATLEGDASALFIKENLDGISIKISRIAFGLPVNSALEFACGSTLSSALRGRSLY